MRGDFGPRPGRALSQFVAVTASPKRSVVGPVLAFVFFIVAAAVTHEWILWIASAGVGLLLGLLLPNHPVGTIEHLDQQRRLIGLDRALGPQKLALLEPAARRWEQIDNAMQSEGWKAQEDLRGRVMRASQFEMSRIITQVMRDRSGQVNAGALKDLANAVDAVTAAMGAYERPEFDSTGAPLGAGLPAVADLEKLLDAIELGVEA